MAWRLLADATLVAHLVFIAFTVFGGFLARGHRWARIVHPPVVAYGVMIQLVGFTCPLTPLENAFRTRAGQGGYDGGFVEHYLVSIIYPGELTLAVTLVLAAGLVAITAIAYRPLFALTPSGRSRAASGSGRSATVRVVPPGRPSVVRWRGVGAARPRGW